MLKLTTLLTFKGTTYANRQDYLLLFERSAHRVDALWQPMVAGVSERAAASAARIALQRGQQLSHAVWGRPIGLRSARRDA